MLRDRSPLISRRPSRALVAALAATFAATAPLAYGHGQQSHQDEIRGDSRVKAAPKIVELTGRMQPTTVITAGVIRQYPFLVTADGQRYRLANGGAAPAGATVTVSGAIEGRVLTTQSVRGAMAASGLAPRSTARSELTGTIRVFHIDYPNGTSEYGYSLIGDNGRTNVIDFGVPLPGIDNGSRAMVSGPMDTNGFIAVDTIEVLGPPARPTAHPAAAADAVAAAVTTTNYAVAPLQFPGGSAPITIASIKSSVFGASPVKSAAEYYKEVSYGAQLLGGFVISNETEWLKPAVDRPSACSTNSELDAVLNTIETQAKLLAATASSNPVTVAPPTIPNGLDWNTYPGGILYVVDALSCGWSGLGYIGYPRAYTNGTASLLVVGHEMGHNFGLYHAGSVDCGANVIASSSCTVTEYGDPWVVMGNQRAGHFNAYQKGVLNYISSGIATHTAGTASYTLGPIESPGQSLYAVQIPTSKSNRTYWVEFRQGIGFDAGMTGIDALGAQIRLSYPFENQAAGYTSSDEYDDTQFLDMTPGTASFTDGALLNGQTFTDSATNVTIKVTAASTSSVTVQVTTGGGTASTTTTLASSANPSVQGQLVTFTATVVGASPTGSVAFTRESVVVAGCSAQPLSGSGNTRTAACTTNSLPVGTHNIIATYSGDSANGSSTSAVLVQTVSAGNPTTTKTILSSDINPSPANATIGLVATVSSPTPVEGGTVSFTSNGSSISGCSAIPIVTNGSLRTATCSTLMPSGAYTLRANYSGTSINLPSSSLPYTHVVSYAAIGNTLQLARTSYAVNESAGTVSIGVTRIGDPTAPASVSYVTSAGSASAGADYTHTEGALAWSANETTTRFVTVPIVSDATSESNETFSFALSNATGAALGAVSVAAVTIVDDETAPVAMPGTGTVSQNPYGTLSVTGATLNGNTISGLGRSTVIHLGSTSGASESFAKIDFEGLDIGPGNTLTVRSGAPGQTVYLTNVGASVSTVAGMLVADGATPPRVVVQSAAGITVASSGVMRSAAGVTLDALGPSAGTGGNVVNEGTVDGGSSLVVSAARINGGGAYKGNAITLSTFGNVNNPVNGPHFVANGLRLFSSSSGAVLLTLSGYGATPQVMNVMVHGDALVTMPSSWSSGSTLPPNNLPVMPGQIRAAGSGEPAYGGGSMIVQASGSLTLVGSDFVFPGGIAFIAGGSLNVNNVPIDNGWTTSGAAFQGVFFQGTSIVSAAPISVRTNNLNWANFSTRPNATVSTWTLQQQGNGSAAFVASDSTAPHLNFYAIVSEAGAAGQCYPCLVNGQVMDFSAAP